MSKGGEEVSEKDLFEDGLLCCFLAGRSRHYEAYLFEYDIGLTNLPLGLY